MKLAYNHGAAPGAVLRTVPQSRGISVAARPAAPVRFEGVGRSRLFTFLTAGLVGLTSLVSGCAPSADNSPAPYNPPAATAPAGQVNGQTAQATTVPVKLQVNPNWFGKAVDGQLDGKTIQISIDPAFFGKHITGTFQGQSVDLRETKGFVSKTVEGTIGGQKVKFDVSPTFFGKHVQGTFMDQPVDLQTSPNFFGIQIKGSFQGNAVDFSVSPDFFGKDLDGTFGGQKVHLDVNPSWFGKEISGSARVQDHQSFNRFMAFLLSDLHLLKTGDKD